MTIMDEKFLSPYSPSNTEDRIYEKWEKSKLFSPEECLKQGLCSEDSKVFSMVLPPPNVTGALHMGHATMLVIQDILTRYHRMLGYKTLWLPGTDHAAIATQSKVEKEIYKKEKKVKEDFGREEFLNIVKQFAEENHNTIVNQIKKMGASLDWGREAYTLDDVRQKAVFEAFKKMYEMGVIYKGNRIVNWDPRLATTISNDEIEWKDVNDNFYYLQYGPFTIGTARPETKFGDKYVVMHPDDERYKEYQHGQTIDIDWINGKVQATIIKDKAVDKEFGTGVMTITPWHDSTDFDIAERHNLDKEQIIDEKGKLMDIAGEFAGIHIKKARTMIVEKFKELSLLVKIDENYTHKIATNSRGSETIEPQIKEQWFVAVDKEFTIPYSEIKEIPSGSKTNLKEIMRVMIDKEYIKITPDRFIKSYKHWVDNLHDWCISRQIWFGHRIPMWYRNKEMICSYESPGDDWIQDEDTLDTWFSSGIWTFSTLGWPEESEDLKTYHPTNVLETGYDILFFWVMRMIMMSGCLLGKQPFNQVYLHGLVRDEKGRKMSKSLGNVMDPLDMIEKYGTDATRLSLIIGITPGNDVPLSEQKVKSYKHFGNKLWNISRFVLSNVEYEKIEKDVDMLENDTKLLNELDQHIASVTNQINSLRFHLAGEELYEYLWHRFADKIIEESKPILNGDDEKAKISRQKLLYTILTKNLILLHPFMPFVTEEIWSSMPHNKSDSLLMSAKWPISE